MTVGERFGYIRKELRLSKSAVATFLVVPPQQIVQIENNETTPTDVMLHNMAYRYGISFNWLTHGEGDPMVDQRILQDKVNQLAELALENVQLSVDSIIKQTDSEAARVRQLVVKEEMHEIEKQLTAMIGVAVV